MSTGDDEQLCERVGASLRLHPRFKGTTARHLRVHAYRPGRVTLSTGSQEEKADSGEGQRRSMQAAVIRTLRFFWPVLANVMYVRLVWEVEGLSMGQSASATAVISVPDKRLLAGIVCFNAGG